MYVVLWLYLGIGKTSKYIDSSDAYIFRNAALICLGVGGLASLIFHLTIKNEFSIGDGNAENIVKISAENNQEKGDCSDTNQDITCTPSKTVVINTKNSSAYYQPMTIKDWFREPQFYQIGCVYMFTRLFVNTTQVFMPFYLQVTLKLKAVYVAVIPLVMYLSGMVVAFVMKSVIKCLGKKTAYAVSCIIGGTGCLWIHWGA